MFDANYQRSNTKASLASYQNQQLQVHRNNQNNIYTPYEYVNSATMNPKRTSELSSSSSVQYNNTQPYVPYQTSHERRGYSNGMPNDVNNLRGRNTLQNNASLIMNQSGTASSTNINRASAAQAKSGNPGSEAENDSYWQRHNQLFERGSRQGPSSNSEYYNTNNAPPGLITEKPRPNIQMRGQANPTDGYGARSGNENEGDPYGGRDRMNQRLKKIRDDLGQSPIQTLTHKQILLQKTSQDNSFSDGQGRQSFASS